MAVNPKDRKSFWFILGVFAFALIFSLSMKEPPRRIDLASVQESSGNPSAVADAVKIFGHDIYKTTTDIGKLPVEWVKNMVIRETLKNYLRDLPLTADVRARVEARIESEMFVDEIVPFLLFLKDQYQAPEGSEPWKFASYLKKTYPRPESISGFRHSMYKKAVETGSASSPSSDLKLDPQLAAAILRFYDAVFLQTEVSPIHAERVADPGTIARVQPIVRELLEKFAAQTEPGGDLGDGIHSILADPQKVETLTITLIEGIADLALKNYRMFSRQAMRVIDLRNWFHRELDEPKAGRLWRYLRYSLLEKRYAFHVVVDGLQGHLIEALARPEENKEFLAELARMFKDQEKFRPKKVESRRLQGHETRFLERIASQGYDDVNYLPFFRNLYRRHSAGLARFGISTTPTISVRNLPVAKTGAPVVGLGATGIPNFHFVDRSSDRAYYFYGNDVLQLEKLTKKTGLESMFDRLRGLKSMNCNAQYDRNALKSYDHLLNLVIGEKARDFGDLLCYVDIKQRARNEKRLRGLMKRVLDYESILGTNESWWGRRMIAKEQVSDMLDEIAELDVQGLPEYLLYYNPWPDHFAHFEGPFSDDILAPSGELNRLDYWLKEFTALYVEAGVYERTLFGMAGDHGLTPVFFALNPEVVVFDAMKAEGKAWIVEKISSDEGEGPKMTHPYRPPTMKGKDVVIASTAGGNYMMDFFKDQGDGWRRQPVYRDLLSYRTLANQTFDMIKELTSRLGDSLDYLVVREEPCDRKWATVRVIGPRGGKLGHALVRRRGRQVMYEFKKESDLLDVTGVSAFYRDDAQAIAHHGDLIAKCIERINSKEPSTWCHETEWRLLTSYTSRPDSVVQISRIYDTDRAGTINLFPVTGVGYNTIVPGRHAGEGFHEKDAFVGVWGAPVRSKTRLQSEINGSVPVTIYEYLTGQTAEEKDGWGYRSLLKDLTERSTEYSAEP